MAPPTVRATAIAGLLEIRSEPHCDARGFFLNAWREE